MYHAGACQPRRRAILYANRQVLRCVPENDPRYRYVLEVGLEVAPHLGPRLCVILKNPSRASAFRSDPTVGKVEAWARRHGFVVVTYVNLFAVRATIPSHLNALSYAESVGAENNAHILDAATLAHMVIAGWGNPNGISPATYQQRVDEVLRLLAQRTLHIVGSLTRRGYPRHGLLWNGDPAPTEWHTPVSLQQ